MDGGTDPAILCLTFERARMASKWKPSMVQILVGLPSSSTTSLGSDDPSSVSFQPPMPAAFPVHGAAAQPNVLPELLRQWASALHLPAAPTSGDPGCSPAPARRLPQPAAWSRCICHCGASPADGGNPNRGEPGASPGTSGLL